MNEKKIPQSQSDMSASNSKPTKKMMSNENSASLSSAAPSKAKSMSKSTSAKKPKLSA